MILFLNMLIYLDFLIHSFRSNLNFLPLLIIILTIKNDF